MAAAYCFRFLTSILTSCWRTSRQYRAAVGQSVRPVPLCQTFADDRQALITTAKKHLEAEVENEQPSEPVSEDAQAESTDAQEENAETALADSSEKEQTDGAAQEEKRIHRERAETLLRELGESL